MKKIKLFAIDVDDVLSGAGGGIIQEMVVN
jgi:hypothetical protein